jgi:hypothetical protein
MVVLDPSDLISVIVVNKIGHCSLSVAKRGLMQHFTSTIAILLALGPLSGCGDGDIRERTYAEVACFGTLGRHNNKYECVGDGSVEQLDRSKTTDLRKVTVNRRTGAVAFDGRMVGECRVADFDAWECVERVPIRGALGRYDSIQYRSGLSGGGYLEQWCSVSPDAPAARNPKNCKGAQRYYGIPVSESRLRAFLWDQFCSTEPSKFCSWF